MRQFGSLHSEHYTSSRVGAWAVIQAGSTSKLHSSYNISTLTDNGAGDFTLVFAIPFASASDYAIVVSSSAGNFAGSYTDVDTPPSASTIRVVTVSDGLNALTDRDPTTVLCVGRR